LLSHIILLSKINVIFFFEHHKLKIMSLHNYFLLMFFIYFTFEFDQEIFIAQRKKKKENHYKLTESLVYYTHLISTTQIYCNLGDGPNMHEVNSRTSSFPHYKFDTS
jgi:hypothetical protein